MQVSVSVNSQWANNNREITPFLETNITSSSSHGQDIITARRLGTKAMRKRWTRLHR